MTTSALRSLIGYFLALWPLTAMAAGPELVPSRVPATTPDVAEVLSPAAVHLDGWLGTRLAVNEKNRLLQGGHRAVVGRLS